MKRTKGAMLAEIMKATRWATPRKHGANMLVKRVASSCLNG
jgi:hypothetical protein